METFENDLENDGDIALKKIDPKLTSILKPSQKENQLSAPQLLTPTLKIKSKVTFKNTPQQKSPQPSPIKVVGPHGLGWKELRELDDAERWTERTQVVTKEDHSDYFEIAKCFLKEVIDNLPIVRAEESATMADTEQELNGNNGLDDLCNEDFIDQEFCMSRINNKDFSEVEKESSVNDIIMNDNKESLLMGFDDESSLLTDSAFQLLDVEFDSKQTDEVKKEITINDSEDLNFSEEIPQKTETTSEVDCPKTESEITDLNSLKTESETILEVDNKMIQPAVDDSSENVFIKEEQVVPDNEDDFLETLQTSSQLVGDNVESNVDTVVPDNSSPENVLDNDIFGDEFGEGEFRSGEQVFSLDIDYLENFGQPSEDFKASALARQSLYVKFDPLVKTNTPPKDAVKAKNKTVQPRLQNDDLLFMNTPPKTLNTTAAKFAAVRTSSVPVDLPQPKGVDKLLTFSPAKGVQFNIEEMDTRSALDQEEDDGDNLVAPLLYSKSDCDAAVKKERAMMEKKAREESQIRDLESQEQQKKINELKQTILKLQSENTSLGTVMGEYERTMTQMIESSDKERKGYEESKAELIKEKEQIQIDLNSVETAFGDLHRRFEKLKGAVEGFKKNEETLKKVAKDYQEKLKKAEDRYGMLKKHAEEKIESANIEINKVRKSFESELTVARAAVKKEVSKSSSLEKSLQQKDQENKELTAICDELINKMQTH